jgi:Skp family chaperone for outer membrane proteins
MAQTLESLIEREFEQVGKEREDLMAKRAEIDDALRALDRRLEAAANYKATLEGTFTRRTAERRPRARSSTRAPRGARAELRTRIIDLIKQFPDGLTAEGINNELQATDPKEKQKIANVLSLMKQDGQITQEQRRGPYKVAA